MPPPLFTSHPTMLHNITVPLDEPSHDAIITTPSSLLTHHCTMAISLHELSHNLDKPCLHNAIFAMLSLTHPGTSTSMVTQPHHLHTSHMRHLVAITNITHPNTLHTHDTTHIYMCPPNPKPHSHTIHSSFLPKHMGYPFGGVGGTPKSTVLVHSFILCPRPQTWVCIQW